MIDISVLPQNAMVDTGIFLRYLGDRPTDPDAPICRAFCEAMINSGRTVFIAAPTLAEIVRHRGQKVPRVKNVVVIPFDARAAEILGENMPMAKLHETKNSSGQSMTYLKYDSLIMACAIRSRTSAFITLDTGDHGPLANGLGIDIHHPREFEAPQRTLLFELPAAVHPTRL